MPGVDAAPPVLLPWHGCGDPRPGDPRAWPALPGCLLPPRSKLGRTSRSTAGLYLSLQD